MGDYSWSTTLRRYIFVSFQQSKVLFSAESTFSQTFPCHKIKKTVERSIGFKGSVQLLNYRIGTNIKRARRRRQTERQKFIVLKSN